MDSKELKQLMELAGIDNSDVALSRLKRDDVVTNKQLADDDFIVDDEVTSEEYLETPHNQEYQTSEEDLIDDPLCDTDFCFTRKSVDNQKDFTEARERKTEDEFTLQGNYGAGWEDLTTEKSRKAILTRKREYEENEGGNYRTIVRRVKKDKVEENRELSDILRLSGLSEGGEFGSELDYEEDYTEEQNGDEIEVNTWFERDRAHVALTKNGETVVEWWDDDVQQAIEDGYLNPRDWKGSAIEYAKEMGLLGIDESAEFNGYDTQKRYYADDTFPRGNHGSVSNAKGPASAKHGDNPLQSRMLESSLYEANEDWFRRHPSAESIKDKMNKTGKAKLHDFIVSAGKSGYQAQKEDGSVTVVAPFLDELLNKVEYEVFKDKWVNEKGNEDDFYVGVRMIKDAVGNMRPIYPEGKTNKQPLETDNWDGGTSGLDSDITSMLDRHEYDYDDYGFGDRFESLESIKNRLSESLKKFKK